MHRKHNILCVWSPRTLRGAVLEGLGLPDELLQQAQEAVLVQLDVADGIQKFSHIKERG